MHIANPLYDTVFKYMLDDEPVAKLFLSTLLGREIVELHYNPQEILNQYSEPEEKQEQENESKNDNTAKKLTFFSILRLDFAAKIRDKDGQYHIVLIELQKASNGSDIMRFRKYLAAQYGNKSNSRRTSSGKIITIPILPIYFLGEGMSYIKGHSAVKVERIVKNMFTDEVISVKDDFIENLSHNMIIICANEPQGGLNGEIDNGLKKLLSIFNLAANLKYEHLLIINENDYPEEYRPIIRRLQKAAETKELRYQMDTEDDLTDYFVGVERDRDAQRELKESALKTIEENEKIIEKERKEKEKMEKEKQQAEENTNSLMMTLVKIGISENLNAEEIAAKYNLPLASVIAIVAKL